MVIDINGMHLKRPFYIFIGIMCEGISLGWNCHSAIEGVCRGLRKTNNMGIKRVHLMK